MAETAQDWCLRQLIVATDKTNPSVISDPVELTKLVTEQHVKKKAATTKQKEAFPAEMTIDGQHKFDLSASVPECVAIKDTVLSLGKSNTKLGQIKVPLDILALSTFGNEIKFPADGEISLESPRYYTDAKNKKFSIHQKIPPNQHQAGASLANNNYAKFATLILHDAEDVTKGVTIIICVEPCDSVIPLLVKKYAVEAEKNGSTEAEGESDTDEKDKDPNKAEDGNSPDADDSENDSGAQTDDNAQATLGAAIDDLLSQPLAQLVDLVFTPSTDGIPAVPKFDIMCVPLTMKGMSSFKTIVSELYSERCLKLKDPNLEVVSSDIGEFSAETGKLKVNVTIKRKPARFVKNLTFVGTGINVDCLFTVEFGRNENGPWANSTYTSVGALMDGKLGAVLTEKDIQDAYPLGLVRAGLFIKLNTPAEVGQKCALDAPIIVNIDNPENATPVSISIEGDVEVGGLKVLKNTSIEYVFLNTYVGAPQTGTTEQGGVYAIKDKGALLDVLSLYLDHLGSLTQGSSKIETFEFFAPNSNGLYENITSVNVADFENEDWRELLQNHIETTNVAADYFDSHVTSKVTSLISSGEITNRPATVRVFGRTGFEEPGKYCDSGPFQGLGVSRVKIVDFANSEDFPDLINAFDEEFDIDETNKLVAIRCPSAPKDHVMIQVDTATKRNFKQDYLIAFSALEN